MAVSVYALTDREVGHEYSASQDKQKINYCSLAHVVEKLDVESAAFSITQADRRASP
jgi:hypothetical protein